MQTATAKAISAIEPSDFINGKEYIHPTGQIVRFAEGSWYVSTPRGETITIRFDGLPQWLLRAAKLTMAHGWLLEGRSLSWIRSAIIGLRRMGDWLTGFEGQSIADLTDEHSTVLQLRLERELAAYCEAADDRALKFGRVLTSKEKKRIGSQPNMLGPKPAISFVTAFNLAAALYEQIDGFPVKVRLRYPRAINQFEINKGIGSADPRKVLSAEQIAMLEEALNADSKRYEKLRAQLFEIGNLQYTPSDIDKRNTALDVERYFGLHGIRLHTSSEIGILRGQANNSRSEVTKRIRRFLQARIGPRLATEVMGLRSQVAFLKHRKKFAEMKAPSERISVILSDLALVRDVDAFCLEKYFGLNGAGIEGYSAIAEQVHMRIAGVRQLVKRRLSMLVGKTRAAQLMVIRDQLRKDLGRAIKAQVLRLQIGVARRLSAVLELPADPKIKVDFIEGRRVVQVQFVARKTWGDEGMEEWVPCVDKFGEIAEDAIRTAQRLTRDLRKVASEDVAKLLFIIPKHSFDRTVPLSKASLYTYIQTNKKGKVGGLLVRYGLDDLLDFEFHYLRHSHSTHMVEAGCSIHDVAHYLGHTNFNRSATMAGIFYLAGGTESMRRRTADALRRGAATGTLFDGLARLKIEAIGDEAKELPIPPNQLSFEQARQRILSADLIEEIPVEPAEAARLITEKTVVNVTRYGGCILQATSGHCPTSNPCAIGILPVGAEPKLGCGCGYLVILPHSVEQLSADLAIMEAQLAEAEMKGEEWAQWRSHIEAKREHWCSLLETAKLLNESNEEAN